MLNKGDQITIYTLERYLGKGSYGEVWLAMKKIELSDHAIPVALKFLSYQPQQGKAKADFIKEVQREVGIWIKASGHKNVVSVQDGFAFRDDTFVIVSDFAEGGSLGDWLEANGGKCPSLEKTVEIMSEILDGLTHLHSQEPEKIVHRDLKPHNVLLKSGVRCLTDFGVSRMSQTVTKSAVQAAATGAGTPLYMSPESYNNKPASRSMDIWSAGVMLYQLLSGGFPFFADHPVSLALAVINEPPKPLQADVPPELQAVVAKALEKDVSRRFQTAREMKAGLKAALEKYGIAGKRPIASKPVQPIIETNIDEEFDDTSSRFRNSIGMEFVKIQAGSFMMGSPTSEKDRYDDEGPQHRVTISRDFYMGKYEVTQGQWTAVMGTNPSNFKGDNLPVESVSWEDAQEFIKKLNGKGEGTYRLPREAEWEYAARGGTTTAFAFGDSLSSEQANFDGNYPYGGAAKGNYLEKTTEVGSYRANGWGLYDMHGNVWEWCEDWYDSGYYAKSPVTDPTGAATGSLRVFRGGGWSGNGWFLRSALRSLYAPSVRGDDLGFRLIRE